MSASESNEDDADHQTSEATSGSNEVRSSEVSIQSSEPVQQSTVNGFCTAPVSTTTSVAHISAGDLVIAASTESVSDTSSTSQSPPAKRPPTPPEESPAPSATTPPPSITSAMSEPTDATTTSSPAPSPSTQVEMTEAPSEPPAPTAPPEPELPPITFRIIYSRQQFDVTLPYASTVRDVKQHVEQLTGVPVANQKLMLRGLLHDETLISSLHLTPETKLMVVGSKPDDLAAVSSARSAAAAVADEPTTAASTGTPFSQQEAHKRVLDKYGKPTDLTTGSRNRHDPLPFQPISGMYNKQGLKVRLTFKLESDELWVGTKERTLKWGMGSINSIVSEPIVGNEDYHIMGIQIGTTEASRYWIYWVPAQYVHSIRRTILGHN